MMIRIKELSFIFKGKKNWVLRDLCLNATPGECIIVCGSSGCGKTTLTKAVNGLIPHFEKGMRAGRVMLGNRDVKDIPPHDMAGLTGSLFQDPRSQFFTTRVVDEILWGCENLGLGKQEIRRRLDQTLSLFDLNRLRHKSVFDLSNGEKQRAVFGAVWAMAPHVFVLDEPSSNLDPGAVRSLARQIRMLKIRGKTLIIAEHRLFYLADLVDRVVVMDRGRIRAVYTGREIRALSPGDLEHRGLRQLNLNLLHPEPCSGNTGSGARLTLKNLAVSYKKTKTPVIINLDLEIRQGEIIGICGPNGSGKTTLGRLISGLIKETRGTISLGNKPMAPVERIKVCHLVLQQADHQLFRPSVKEELALMTEKKTENSLRMESIIHTLDLGPFMNCHPQALSGGQKQRLAIACGLLRDPAFLILDEPTSGMDAGHMLRLAGLLKTLARNGRGVIVVTHDYEFLLRTCSRVLIMDRGRIKIDRDTTRMETALKNYLVRGTPL